MLRIRFPRFAPAFFLLLSLTLSAQVSHLRPAAAPPAPKLTPQQQTGLTMLDQQSAAAEGFSPVMRSFALLEISHGYENLEKPKALAALRGALHATQAMEEPTDPRDMTKRNLQSKIITQLASLDADYCEQLVPQLAGSARGFAISTLVARYTGEKQFARAVALLGQLGDQEFPYMPTASLLQALPPQMAADKQNLFAQALASYSAHEHKSGFSLDDFDVLISRNWQGLPPALVLEAVDEVLRQARESGAKLQITVGADKGAASFSSVYEYKLFGLMPVLRALDPGRAQELLQQNRDLQGTVQRFPNGLQSLDATHGVPTSVTMRVAGSGGAPGPAADYYVADLLHRQRQIITDAKKDPKQAVAAAMSMPDLHNMRALTLLEVAEALLPASPGYARDALDGLMKVIPSVDQDIAKAQLLAGAGDAYLRLGDNDDVKKVVDEGFKFAEGLYATDTDAEDPNQAFKAEWPSTSAWRRFVALATRISPQTALQAINSIPDPEIQSLETIALANSLLGASPGLQIVQMKTRSGKHDYMMVPR